MQSDLLETEMVKKSFTGKQQSLYVRSHWGLLTDQLSPTGLQVYTKVWHIKRAEHISISRDQVSETPFTNGPLHGLLSEVAVFDVACVEAQNNLIMYWPTIQAGEEEIMYTASAGYTFISVCSVSVSFYLKHS